MVYMIPIGLGWRSGYGTALTYRKVPGSIPGGVNADFFRSIRQFHVPGVDSTSKNEY
jgi:hypothetical protein